MIVTSESTRQLLTPARKLKAHRVALPTSDKPMFFRGHPCLTLLARGTKATQDWKTEHITVNKEKKKNYLPSPKLSSEY